MRISHLLIAGATAVSFSAIAADEQKAKDEQPQAQSSQSQSASGGQSQSASSGQSQETIKQVQEKLSAAGHEVQADGIMGPKTEAALKEFQQSKNLEASGQLDQKTLAALGVSEGGATASTGASGSASPGGSASSGSSADKSSESSSDKSSSSAEKSSSGSAAGGASSEPKSESTEKSKQ